MIEHAKETYLRIMNFIKSKEKNLKENQDLKITLLHRPDLEILEIGRLGSEYLFFSGGGSLENLSETFLLPPGAVQLHFEVVDKALVPGKSRQLIGFRGDVSEEQ